MRGEAPGFFKHTLDSDSQGAAPHYGAAASEGTDALLHCQGVSVSNRHVIHGDAQLLGGDLGEYGLMPLPVGTRAGEHGDLSGALHPNRAALEAGAATRLDKSRDTHADQFA